ncbi:MAG TPA: pilin [Candidatus Saccharimonadales bacterium]|nr:pilin [Candidatus Saccharimonadales bacterium]
MRKYYFIVTAFSFFVLLFLYLPSHSPFNLIYAADTIIDVTCDNPNTAGTNKNGYHSADNKFHEYCPNQEMACVPNAKNEIKRVSNPSSCSGAAARNGCPPPTFTRYVGVECQTNIKCSCSADKKTINCSSVTGNQKQSFACGTAKVCATGPNLSHDVFNQTVKGIDCQESCKCKTPGKAGNGNNGWTCLDNSKSGACTNREDVCENDASSPGGVKCVNNTTCTCSGDNSKLNCISKGSGDNGSDQKQTFDCKGEGKVCKTGKNLSHDVFNQQVPGADCMPIVPTEAPTLPPPPSPPCQQWSNGQCVTFDTALGSFSTNPQGFIRKIFAVLLSVSGGIALLLIMRAGYQLMVSRGNPEQLNQGREQLIAAIIGLLFLIFSFVFLQLIGYDILHLPGFGS